MAKLQLPATGIPDLNRLHARSIRHVIITPPTESELIVPTGEYPHVIMSQYGSRVRADEYALIATMNRLWDISQCKRAENIRRGIE